MKSFCVHWQKQCFLYKYKICPLTSSTNVILSRYQYTLNRKHTVFPSSFFHELIEVHSLSLRLSLSRVWFFMTLWTVARQALPFRGLFRQEYWSGVPFPPPGDLRDPGFKPVSSASPVCRWVLYCWATGEAPSTGNGTDIMWSQICSSLLHTCLLSEDFKLWKQGRWI